MACIPVITIDGPAAAGKGELSRRLAAELGFHSLDSGRIYRAFAQAVLHAQVSVEDISALHRVAQCLLSSPAKWRNLLAVPTLSSDEKVAAAASVLSAIPAVRTWLVEFQTRERRLPGLVADGRDMGSVVFPDACLKVFLTASLSVRAKRRFAQLSKYGGSATIEDVYEAISVRDERDRSRATAPLLRPVGAFFVDSSEMTVEQVMRVVLYRFRQ